MIAGNHKGMAVALVLMPNGENRLQICDTSGKWSHIALTPQAAISIRNHLELPVLAYPPVYSGTEEPIRGFA